ncbi:hypothetical protein [Hymenobacter guriensis]|uniref:Uncharacterized protein n=1 Tax=Hymenobacter guriensis TaxID=2793065 RepID=A0ABS0L497_9BACT|nr:hypothetical protein [Hymenobacter guriensis]MBG8554947.1 hypothetical protein [Hymenobacter guriensis]
MKNYSSSPVAQPQSFGTTAGQSSTHIPAPVCASLAPNRTIRAAQAIREFDYLKAKYQKANFQPQLEALIAMPVLIMKERSGKEWTRFAQTITNQAVFVQVNDRGLIHIQDEAFYRAEFGVSIETASTLCFFTKLYYVLGQLGRTDIPIALDGEYRKQSASGGASGSNFINALQGFLYKANIDIWHKRIINDWINEKIPECEWLTMPELCPNMQIVRSQPKRPGRKPRICPSTFEEALVGPFKQQHLAELISREHLAFYDAPSRQALAEPGQWASLYWALFSLGYIQKLTMGRIPELIAISFNGTTSKSSISAVYRSELIDTFPLTKNKIPAPNTETERIFNILKSYFPSNKKVFSGRL